MQIRAERKDCKGSSALRTGFALGYYQTSVGAFSNGGVASQDAIGVFWL